MSDDRPENPIEEYRRVKTGIPDATLSNHVSTAGSFRDWLTEHHGKDLLEASPVDVKNWLLYLDEEGYAGSTIHNYHSSLKSFYDEYTDTDEASMLPTPLEENPARFEAKRYISDISNKADKQLRAENDEGIIYLEPSEVRQLRKHVQPPKVRNELIIKLLVQTGLRVGELRRLKVEDVDRETEIVHIDDTKNDKTRSVPYDNLDPELSMWLDGGRRADTNYAAESDYLFPTDEAERISASTVGRIVREAAEEAGIQEEWGETPDGRKKRRVTPHVLRATFTMRLFKDGNLPVPTVMKLTGHSELETLKNYAEEAKGSAASALAEADVDFGT